VDLGQAEHGIAELREGVADLARTRQKLLRAWATGLLADAIVVPGKSTEAGELLDGALAEVQETGVRWCEAELWRQKGAELSASDAHGAAAERCFGRAIETAGRQRARLWELRAAASLARLWRDQGKRTEARNLLAPIYGWFTEGFDTPDLKEAKALLEELA
jgi:predicted ATPase